MMTNRHNSSHLQRGFTLLIAIILASVTLAVGLALADIAYKQVVLSSTAKQSQTAFYRADSALECALYYDQQFAAFNSGSSFDLDSVQCEGRDVLFSQERQNVGGTYETTFQVRCPSSGTSAEVSIYKATGSNTCGANGEKNCIYASGYNVCQSGPNRFERGLKVVY